MKETLPEAFFHFIWKYRMLSPNLTTDAGEDVSILHPGSHNTDAGPDFLFARAVIGGTLWVGNVEIHTRASDWYRHGHHKDPAYNNVVLHVVAVMDNECISAAGRKIPSLCLEGRYDHQLSERYQAITANLYWIPCMNSIGGIGKLHVLSAIHARAVDRLRNKASEVNRELEACNMDWDECCYRLIAKQFGAKINIANFEMLATAIPARILMKYHGDGFSLEALLFGQSGLLNQRLKEEYPKKLKQEHAYLAEKHGLSPMPGYLWNFLRLRPAGFPTIRIAQLARLYEAHQRLFREIIDCNDTGKLLDMFRVCASPYWNDHYIFNKRSKTSCKCFGVQGIHLMLINAVIPVLFHYGRVMHQPVIRQRAIAFLEDLPPENNAVVRRWKELGIAPANSLESQGLLELKKSFCDHRRCLECSIGLRILKTNGG